MTVTQELLEKIESSIEKTSVQQDFSQKGEILEVKDGVATVIGLDDVSFSEIVEFENGTRGLVLDLLKEQVGVLILGKGLGISPGDLVTATGQVFSVGVGEAYLGRVVNGLGEPIDGEGAVEEEDVFPVERIAPGVMARQSVDQPLFTGIKAIDAMIPVGRGQRELIIGDRQTGKTTVAIDTILNQDDQDVYCIYVAIGQKESKVRRIVQTLRKQGALDHTVVVSAAASDPAVMQYLAPYIGCALGEYFMNNGKDALIVYDDLSKHAVAYREISLLLRRPPGREAYPGDVFYIHSKLLERSARLNADYIEEITDGKVTGRTGSLTALPIIETQAGDVSAYIPTNVISITDGQIFLETDLFNAGVKPAINVGLSVSRVGGSAQTKVMKKVSGKLKLALANYREMEAFAQFAADLDEATQQTLARGERMVEMLKQGVNMPIPVFKQVVLIYAGINGHLDQLDLDQIGKFEEILYEKLDTSYVSVTEKVQEATGLTDELEEAMVGVIKEAIDEVK